MEPQPLLKRERRERSQRDDQRADELRRIARDVAARVPLAMLAPLALELRALLRGDRIALAGALRGT